MARSFPGAPLRPGSRSRGRIWAFAALLPALLQCSVYDNSLLGAAAALGGAAGSATGGGSGGASGPCANGSQDGLETSIDCGGGECDKCPAEAACQLDTDCLEGSCVELRCAAGSCAADGIKQGPETDTDCGGPRCPPCKAEQFCTVATDCDTGVCTAGQCELKPNCKEILAASKDAADGVYLIDLDGAFGADDEIEVYCSMIPKKHQTAGGWTRVAFESGAAGGPQTQGALSHLEEEVGTPSQIARAFGAGLIGKRFRGEYESVMITWGDEWLEFKTPEDLFRSLVSVAIPLTKFVTSNVLLNRWVGNAGVSSESAIFCRASALNVNPSSTSWAVKSKAPEDANSECGCSGPNWEGRGIFYGGGIPAALCGTLPATTQGGGFAGVRQEGEQKGGLLSTTEVIISIR